MRWDLAAWWRLGEAPRSLLRSAFPTPPMPLVANTSSLSFSSTVVINSLDLVSSAPDLDLSVSYMDSDKEVLQLQDFVGRVQDAIANTSMHCAKALTGLELSSLVTNRWKKIGEGAADLCCITSWCGKPDWVTSIYSTTSNVVLILDAKDGKGIEAWIALDQDSMALFQQNPDIVALTTSQR